MRSVMVSRHTLAPDEGGSPAYREVGGLSVALFTAKDPTKERPSEDRAVAKLLDSGGVVLAVADGVGGQAAGATAASITVSTIGEAVRDAERQEGDMRFALIEALEAANRAVLELANGAATTLAAAIIDKSTVRTFHVGDAMILVVGNRGKIRLQTVAHSPVGYAVEAGVLDPGEAMHHEDRHLVSNVIGSLEMRLEMQAPLELHQRDTVVLASDGLYDNLTIEEIVEIVRKGPLPRAAERLAAACRKRMVEPAEGEPSKPDDLTFVLCRARPS
jgi:PPM family protein phosphatase